MRFLIYDAETRSTLSLKQYGSHVYTCDPSTDVWCVSYCVVTDAQRGPIATWLPSDPVPPDILAAAADPDMLIVAFNDAFERQVEEHILHPRYGWPIFPIDRRRCAQAIALTHALPASLDAVAAALKLKVRKTGVGQRAMKLLAAPRKPHKDEHPTQVYWHDEPDRLANLYEYNRIDVEITAEIVKRLGFIPPHEQAIWQLDAVVNARGIHVDVQLLDAALDIAKQADVELHEKLALLTDGEITGPAQTQRILKWLAQHGCEVTDVQAETLAETLKRPDLAPEVRQLIGLRLDGAHAAVNKLTTPRRWLGDDHRIRQVYRYHGAMPGRFTSLGAQMQNLKKPTIEDVSAAIDTVRSGSLTHMQTRYDRPLAIVGDVTRGMITAAPGHRLFIADLSGIESRGLAWLTNETSKLEAWREFDRTGDSSCEPYSRFGTEELRLKGSEARKIGKVADLAFGYQGSVGAWRRLAPADDATPEQTVYNYRRAWVRRHPNITKFWTASVRQAVNAIERGERFTVARIAFQRKGDFLHLKLPSGRCIHYPFARVYADERSKTFTFRDASGGRWEWYHVLKHRGAFGGLIAENATQALCRDVFVDALLRLEASGYCVVAHLHDEFVCEVPDDFGSLDEFLSIITTPPAWAPDFPVAAKGRIADRFIEIKEAPADDALAELLDTPQPIDDLPWHPPTEAPEITHHGPLHAIESEAPATPDAKFPPLPPEFDDPPPRSNGHAGNGFDYSAGEEAHGHSHFVAAWTYHDANKRPYMRLLRIEDDEGKKYPTQYWNGNRWENGWPDQAIPYRLPELLAAPATEQVFIPEGEKAADAVVALGLLATTNPGGADKWQAELAQHFRGKECATILEDNDASGRTHTQLILAALRGVVPRIAVVAFTELPEKGDVTNWIEAGGNKQLLLTRAAEAHKRSEVTAPFPFVDTSRWRNREPPEREWAVPDRIPRRQVALFSGEGAAGKSTILLHECAAHPLAGDWLGVVPMQGPTFFIDVEDDENEIWRRLTCIARYYDVPIADILDRGLHISSLVGDDAVLATTTNKSGKVEPTPRYYSLLEAVADIKPIMIGIASSACVFAGNENDRSQVQQFVNLLTKFAIVANGAVQLISHPSLTGINTDTGLSGTTQWHNAVRARAYLKGIKPENGEQPDNDLREIVFKKNQYGRLAENILLRYQGGLYLPLEGIGPIDAVAKAAIAEDVFLTLLKRFCDANRNIGANVGPGYAPAAFAREDEAKQAGLSKLNLEVAMRQLFKTGKIWNEPYGKPSRIRYRIAVK